MRHRKKARASAPGKRQSLVVVRAKPGSPTRGLVSIGSDVHPAALGRGGRTVRKREGDGATPMGRMRFLYAYVRRDRAAPSPTRLPTVDIGPAMGWCDAAGHANYNRPVRLPFAAGHERLMRDDRLYDVCIVVNWNIVPRRRNAGSAIFLHIARPGFEPTEGCVAVAPATMRRILQTCGPNSRLVVL